MKMLLFLIPTLLLVAEEAREEVGVRPMSEEAKAAIQAEIERNGTANQELDAEKGERVASGFIFERYPAVYFSSSHHWLIGVTLLDNDKFSLEIEDNSVWKVNSSDGAKALNWKSNDPLVITQNTWLSSWFSGHPYRIINKIGNEHVQASLQFGPKKNGPYTRYIIAIDKDNKLLTLSDNTHWEVSYLDTSIFKDWMLGDAVMIGTNSSWDSSCEGLLINSQMNNCARAKQY